MAENYLQHAEHYNRIIAAAQAQMPIQNTQQNRDDFDDDGDDARDEFENAGNGNVTAEAPAPAVNHGSGPQPVIEGTPAEVALNAEGGRNANGGGRHRDRRPNGGYGQNGQRGDHGQRDHGRRDHGQRAEQGEQAAQQGEQNHGGDAPVENAAPAEQPAAVQFEDFRRPASPPGRNSTKRARPSPRTMPPKARQHPAAPGVRAVRVSPKAPKAPRPPSRGKPEAASRSKADRA